MAASSAKRKHVQISDHKEQDTAKSVKKTKQIQPNVETTDQITVQIVTGDYERVLHGLAATLPENLSPTDDGEQAVLWSETFLFSAHTASVRSVAISPETENGKRYLATGSADERINVYSISSSPPAKNAAVIKPSLNGTTIAENAGNRSLGSLNHHDRAITRLHFPTKAKLFSAAEDNVVAISRTRDWTMLSSIKAPIPKVQGRPSGDTAAPGEVPTGINDLAIHPSQKLMLSVSRGERCMRLWNLMTGKKAGVLNFDRDLLTQAGETKFSSGEGRRVLWDETGEHYIVGFERGAVLFGIDSKPQAVIRADRPTKLHQFCTASLIQSEGTMGVVATSTEDGRVLLFNLEVEAGGQSKQLPKLKCVAQLGGPSPGITTRLKDFRILPLSKNPGLLLVIAASSDGTIWLWSVDVNEINASTETSPKQVGRLLGKHKTESRITCLDAFVMDGKPSSSAEVVEPSSEHDDSSSDDE